MKSQNTSTNVETTPKIILRSHVPEESGKNVPTLDEIHRRSQEIHIERGDHDCGLDGYLDEWLQAERELREKLSNNNDADPRKK